jgi:hypothetical protein
MRIRAFSVQQAAGLGRCFSAFREANRKEGSMKHFLAIYVGTPAAMSRWNSIPDSEKQERQVVGVRAWHEWIDRNKESIVEIGTPLGRTKSISSQGTSDIRNNMTGFTLVRAESHEDAAKLFESHPHFMFFPGDSVEVMECLPIPNNSEGPG